MEIKKFNTDKFLPKKESFSNPTEGVMTPATLSDKVIDILT